MEDTSIQIDDHNAHNGKQECNLSKNFGDIRNYLTVSDDKFVSMPISEEKDVMRIGLKIDEVSRIEDAKEFKSASFRFYAERIYIFTREDDEFLHESTIKVETYDEKIFISNGNLFIYNEKLGSILLFNNSFKVDNMKLRIK
ncbi:10616_t:CDS:2 [Gigaspora rosea]|nr:10616_t:CDS:2 [Gigaspora rosea]